MPPRLTALRSAARVARTPPGRRHAATMITKYVSGSEKPVGSYVSPTRLKEGKPIVSRKISSPSIQVDLRGKTFTFQSLRLRDDCRCSLCVDPSTKQRNIRTSDIPISVRAAEVSRTANWDIRIKWENDIPGFDESHISTYTEADLKRLGYTEYGKEQRNARAIIHWDEPTFARNQHWLSFDDYMSDETKFRLFMRSLHRYGLVFLKNVPEEEASVAKIAERMGPLRNTFYGTTWDVRNTKDAKNVAYTNKNLGFHMDLMYMANPPAYQLLHCMSNSLEGGESLFADAFRAANRLYQKDPQSFHVLREYPVRFAYENDNHYYEYVRPTIGPVTHEFTRINYSPPFQGTPVGYHITKRGKPMKLQHSDFAYAIKRFENELHDPRGIFELKLKAGECVIFANQRVVHARRGFAQPSSDAPGSRWLRGTYVDEDPLMSKFEVYRAQHPDEWNVTIEDEGKVDGRMTWYREFTKKQNSDKKGVPQEPGSNGA